MNRPGKARKQRGLVGFWYDTNAKKGYVHVKRPAKYGGGGGRRPWSKVFSNVSIEEARKLYWQFREHCLKFGGPPGQAPPSGPFSSMPTLKQFLDKCGLPGQLSERTAKDQGYVVDAALLPVFGEFPLDRISKGDLAAFQTGQKAKNLSPSTINQKLRILRKILRDALDREIIEKLPRFPSEIKERQPPLEVTDDDVEALLKAFDNPESNGGAAGPAGAETFDRWMKLAKPLFTIAIDCGLARSDLRTLRWTDIDFKRRLIVRERNKTAVKAIVPLTDRALAALQEVKARSIADIEYVFVTPARSPYSFTTIRRYFARAKRSAGLQGKRIRFHDLRHHFLTKLASRGAGAFMIQKAAGHASVRTSQRYVHDLDPAAIEFMRKALSS